MISMQGLVASGTHAYRFVFLSTAVFAVAAAALVSAPNAGAQGAPGHSADQSGSRDIELSELLRVIQFFNSDGYHCAEPADSTEDGYVPGADPDARQCTPHDSDYAPQNWEISLSELLRLIQFFNAGGYHLACGTEDGFAPGTGEDCVSEGEVEGLPEGEGEVEGLPEGEGEGEGEGVQPPTLEEAAQTLWNDFASLDTDGSGSINYQQALQALPSLTQSQFLTLSDRSASLSQFNLADFLGEPEPFVETNLIDPEEIVWAALRNMTSSSLETQNNQQRSAGRKMVDIGFDEVNQRYHAVWHQNIVHVESNRQRDWEAVWDLNESQYAAAANQFASQGLRPIDKEVYFKDGNRRYAAIWIENIEDLGWRTIRDADSSTYGNLYFEYRDDGYIPIDLEGYDIGDNDIRFSSVWVENVDDLNIGQLRNMTSESYGNNLQEFADDGFRVLDLTSYVRNGEQNFAAIWVENNDRKAFQGPQRVDTGGRAWGASRNLTGTVYGDRIRFMVDRGYRPTKLASYQTPQGNLRFAAVWRQNSMRTTWPLRNDIDEAIEDHMEDQDDLPAVSVAIVHEGEFVYRRGFGERDADEGRPADARTIYRLASVSKPMTATIAMRLHEQGVIDLDDPTRDYLPAMPAHHTHTLRDLASIRGCVRHYGEGPSDRAFQCCSEEYDQYDTALSAAQEFWNDPLIQDHSDMSNNSDLLLPAGATECVPGQGVRYSTHGFTLLAAALEAATGVDFQDLIAQELAGPFNLSTLAAEDRESSETHRARIHRRNNNLLLEGTPFGPYPASWFVDNLSWKYAGGGMEGSVYDLARFARFLLNGQIVSPDSRDEMWTRITNLSTYGVGWRSGNVALADGSIHYAVRHSGSQQGGNAMLLVYPDSELIVVAMANRQVLTSSNDGVHVATLAWDIGDMVLSSL